MKDGFIKVAAASVPLRVADCGYNAQQCAAAVSQAKRLRRILALPELCLTGYTCHDLFGQEALRQGALAGLAQWRDHGRRRRAGICGVALCLERTAV